MTTLFHLIGGVLFLGGIAVGNGWIVVAGCAVVIALAIATDAERFDRARAEAQAREAGQPWGNCDVVPGERLP